MTLYNIFDTFKEANSAQEYDFNIFKAKKFAEKTGIDVNIILSLSLHLDQNLRHSYYQQNGIEFSDDKKAELHDLVNYFFVTNRFSNIYSYGSQYVYAPLADSDQTYNQIDLSLDEQQNLIFLTDNGEFLSVQEQESL